MSINRLYIILSLLVVGPYTSLAQAFSAPKETPGPQSSISLNAGPTAGVNFSDFIHRNLPGGKSHLGAGFYAGGALRLNLLPVLSVEGNLLFQYRRSEFGMFGNTGNFTQWSEEIAVMAVYHCRLPHKSSLNIGLGAFNDFGLSANYKYKGRKYDLYDKGNDTNYPTMSDSETGVVCKVGYEFRFGLEINASYRLCINNLTEGDNKRIAMRPQTLSIGVTWFFRKK